MDSRLRWNDKIFANLTYLGIAIDLSRGSQRRRSVIVQQTIETLCINMRYKGVKGTSPLAKGAEGERRSPFFFLSLKSTALGVRLDSPNKAELYRILAECGFEGNGLAEHVGAFFLYGL